MDNDEKPLDLNHKKVIEEHKEQNKILQQGIVTVNNRATSRGAMAVGAS